MTGSPSRDVRELAADESQSCDVCVLGAGPVGLALSRALVERGVSVTLIERGGATASAPDGVLDASAQFDSAEYRGAEHGRAFGIGGTSALWGGQLLPVRRADLDARPQIRAPRWPLDYSELEVHFAPLQRWLGVNPSAFDLSALAEQRHPLTALNYGDWSPRLSKWLSYGARNLAAAWSGPVLGSERLRAWVNATGQTWSFSGPTGSRALEGIRITNERGSVLTVLARHVVVAAGALETARILIDMGRQAGDSSLSEGTQVGRYLHDHLSVRIFRVQIADEARFDELFAPIFAGPTMRSLRMELTEQALARDGLPALYAHVVAEANGGSGFALVRDCLRALQRRRFGDALLLGLKVPAAAPEVLQLLYTRIVRQRLMFPRDSALYVHVDFEQAPRRESRVYLGDAGTDGRRRLRIDWCIDPTLPTVARKVQGHFLEFWRRNGLEKVATLQPIDCGDEPDGWSRNVYDIYHPAGTARMGADPCQSVVDPELKVHGLTNVHVVGSSVFPSMGAANPTFTAMLLAVRLAAHLERELRRS